MGERRDILRGELGVEIGGQLREAGKKSIIAWRYATKLRMRTACRILKVS